MGRMLYKARLVQVWAQGSKKPSKPRPILVAQLPSWMFGRGFSKSRSPAAFRLPGRMVCDSGMNVDIAVALFEKGYAEAGDAFSQSRYQHLLQKTYMVQHNVPSVVEASVQEAIKSCSTLEEEPGSPRHSGSASCVSVRRSRLQAMSFLNPKHKQTKVLSAL